MLEIGRAGAKKYLPVREKSTALIQSWKSSTQFRVVLKKEKDVLGHVVGSQREEESMKNWITTFEGEKKQMQWGR